MLSWIISTSMHLRGLAIGLAVCLTVLGIYQLQKMPRDVFPEFEVPVVEIQTEALGLSAEEVRNLVTLNIEELLSGVPWVTSMSSESITGLSSIKLTFERGTDLLEARQMISERLTLAYALPNISEPPHVLQPKSTTSRFMMIGISSDQIEPTELSTLTQWTIKPRLLGVTGVSNVAVWGMRPRELQVQLEPERLRDARLIQEDIFRAAGNSLWVTPLSFLRGSSPGTGGFIDNHNQRLGVHHQMPIFQPEDLAKVALSPKHLLMTGKQMTLGEVAEVTYDHAPMIGDAIVNGGEAGLLLVLDKLPSANTLQVTKSVEQALADLRLGFPGVTFDAKIFKLSSYIETSLSNLVTAITIASILIALTIALYLYSWRAALISLLAIPVSIVTALLIMQAMGATLNTLLLTGLVVALAVVIGDSIHDVDRLLKHIKSNEPSQKTQSVLSLIYQSILNTKGTAIFATLAMLIAATPIFFLGGLAGEFLKPFATTYIVAVIASFVVGTVLTPALSVMLLSHSYPVPTARAPWAKWKSLYESSLSTILKAPGVAVAVGGCLIAAGLATAFILDQSLLPDFKEQNVVVNWRTAPGTSLQETSRIVGRASRELRSIEGVNAVDAHIGRAVSGDQVVGINEAQIWINIDAEAPYEQTLESIRNTINGYPGVDADMEMYLRDTVSTVITGSDNPVVVRIYGHDYDQLEQKAKEVEQALANVDVLTNIRTIGQTKEPQVSVKVDLDAAAKANVKPGEVRRSAATIFSGLNVGFIFEEQKLFNVTVWSPPEARNSIKDLENILVEKSDRHHVRLGDVASVNIVETPTIIRHERISPFIDVVAQPTNVLVGVGEINRSIREQLDQIQFPLEYHPQVLGEYAERQGVSQKVFGLAAASIIGIFLLLQACFHSWRLAAIAFASVPSAIAGGLVMIAIFDGGIISIGSIIGLMALLGISTRFNIFQISSYQKLKLLGIYSTDEVIKKSSVEGANSVIASSLAILVSMIPFVILGNKAGLEIIEPATVVIFGGILTSSGVTLFILPAIYAMLGSNIAPADELNLDFIGSESMESYRSTMDMKNKDLPSESKSKEELI